MTHESLLSTYMCKTKDGLGPKTGPFETVILSGFVDTEKVQQLVRYWGLLAMDRVIDTIAVSSTIASTSLNRPPGQRTSSSSIGVSFGCGQSSISVGCNFSLLQSNEISFRRLLRTDNGTTSFVRMIY